MFLWLLCVTVSIPSTPMSDTRHQLPTACCTLLFFLHSFRSSSSPIYTPPLSPDNPDSYHSLLVKLIPFLPNSLSRSPSPPNTSPHANSPLSASVSPSTTISTLPPNTLVSSSSAPELDPALKPTSLFSPFTMFSSPTPPGPSPPRSTVSIALRTSFSRFLRRQWMIERSARESIRMPRMLAPRMMPIFAGVVNEGAGDGVAARGGEYGLCDGADDAYDGALVGVVDSVSRSSTTAPSYTYV
ncbi:hypothetical protein M011DRAFT_324991 [Sporormia fimetaria CBS 119925]|uniref:REJ domain-containing protein n=1 Tax=Sporormia fimetaria CBS 119925 TaxID=1340428 RepID=A0A6A6VIQ7_9PLEO|nr:hypothetical protein M011DRAFT_324991 [Sporormia fimetaria CBS 119925]